MNPEPRWAPGVDDKIEISYTYALNSNDQSLTIAVLERCRSG